ATLQTADIMSAAAHGGTPTPLFCLKDGMRPQDIVAVIRLEIEGHADRKDYPAPTAIIGGAIDAYPCVKTVAAPAAPVHHSKKRRTRH
ncbi:MAG TPA: Rap1a/Tai family immunity protein, partial [Caulobacteraceae bacterium]|nr:Rap1a/Tai family immunity protein [Caulobacteraceae bacterium]